MFGVGNSAGGVHLSDDWPTGAEQYDEWHHDAVVAEAVAGNRGALREVLEIVSSDLTWRPPGPTQLLGSVATPIVCTYLSVLTARGDAKEATLHERNQP
jgi:hypothetical protein